MNDSSPNQGIDLPPAQSIPNDEHITTVTVQYPVVAKLLEGSTSSHVTRISLVQAYNLSHGTSDHRLSVSAADDFIILKLDHVCSCRRVIIKINQSVPHPSIPYLDPTLSCWQIKSTTNFKRHSTFQYNRYIAERSPNQQASEVFWIDAIHLPKWMISTSTLEITLEEDFDIFTSRENIDQANLALTIIPNAGYGDILTGLVFQGIFLRLIGLDDSSLSNLSIVVRDNEVVDSIRRLQLVGIEKYIKIKQFIDPSTHLYSTHDINVVGKPSFSSHIHELMLQFLNKFENPQANLCDFNILGLTRDYEFMINALEEQFDKGQDLTLGSKLYDAFYELFMKHFFFDLSQKSRQEDLPSDFVLCHVRLGDFAFFDIGGIVIVPHTLHHYRESYENMLESIQNSRRLAYTPESVFALADKMYPDKTKLLVTDGYEHSLEVICNPLNIQWVANKLGISTEEAVTIINHEYQSKMSALEKTAHELFNHHAIIGNSQASNERSIHAMAACDVCISTFGHFGFSIMNYLSQKNQLLYVNPLGPRFKVKRRNLVTIDLPPVDSI